MVDFQSRYKIYSFGYISPRPRVAKHSAQQVKHEANRLLSKCRADRPVHACRLSCMIDYNDPQDWEAQLLFHGLQQTYCDVEALHAKLIVQAPCINREPDKLLLQVGIKGSGNGDFHYPRDLITSDEGDIIIADTNNHRIQIITQFGVFNKKFGKKGKGEGEFMEPTGVSQFPNGDIVVADSKNKRIQIFSFSGTFKKSLTTKSEPYSVCTDGFKNIIVATIKKTIEIYDRDLKLVSEFVIPGRRQKRCFMKMCTDGDDDIYLSDTTSGSVKRFSYAGKLKHEFQPQAPSGGLVVMPSDIALDILGQIVLSDALNHTVNVYTTEGRLVKQVLTPPDELGAAFALAVSPEGHIVVAEFAMAAEHCVKIFRYTKCECHQSRPSSSKRRTPTTRAA